MFLRRKTTVTTSDEELVLAVRGGHQSALGDLWDRYAHLLFGTGMKYLKNTEQARDAVVELFAALPELLKKHEIDRFRPWVHTVMRNRCLMLLRKDRHAAALPEDQLAENPTEDNEEALHHEQDLQQLERAINDLNEQQRTCIRLFYMERLSYIQVEERTGYNYDQLRSHLQNGRRNLRLILERHADQNA